MRNIIQSMIALAALSTLSIPTFVHAADPYPVKPVKLIVPFAAGGGTDALARIMAQKLSEKWGQSMVVDNRAGAEGVIGSQAVAQSPADGYTLLWAVPSHAINPSVRANMPFDTLKAFVPVTLVAATPYVLAAGKKLTARTMQELIAQAKAKPNSISYGTNDVGGRILGEMVRSGAGIEVVNVPYKGSGPMVNDVLGGHIDMGFISLPSAMSYFKAGTLKLLAVSSAKRTRLAPELPTMVESGLKDFDMPLWWGILAPAGTAPDIVNKIYRDLAQLAEQGDLRDALMKAGAEPVISSPQEFQKFFSDQIVKSAAIVKATGITAE